MFNSIVLHNNNGKLSFKKNGNIFANKTHAFNGHDKWDTTIKSVKVNPNSITLELDSIVNPIIASFQQQKNRTQGQS